MKTSLIVLLLLGGAFAQTSPAQKKQTSPSAAPASTPAAKAQAEPAGQASAAPAESPASVPASSPVITIKNSCPTEAIGDACTTVVTKEQFEKVMAAVKAPPEAKQRLASVYAQMLTMANEAAKRGVDKDPDFQTRLEIQRQQVLAGGMQQKLQAEAKPTDAEVSAFYTANAKKFQEFELSRIMVPMGDAKTPAKSAELKALADKLRARAVAGESLDKLQAEAWEAAKAPGISPKTDLGWKRSGTIDPKQESAFENLKDGGVSEVVNDGSNLFIYKVVARRTTPLESVKQQIEQELGGKKMQAMVEKIFADSKPDFNETYFGKMEPPQPGPGMQRPPGSRP